MKAGFIWIPETKRRSMAWIQRGKSAPTKFKTRESAGKVMLPLFWGSQEVLLAEYLSSNWSANKDSYCKTLFKLRTVIKRERPGKLSVGIVFIHGNARPHVATLVPYFLTEWMVCFRTPCLFSRSCTVLYHVFPGLKTALTGKKQSELTNLQAAVANSF